MTDLPTHLADYDSIEPPDAPPDEYNHHERRAEVWSVIQAAGSPRAINQAALARRFDVSRTTIGRDMNRIAEYVEATLGDDLELRSRAVFERAVADALDRDDSETAWRITREWLDWLHKSGARDKPAEKVDVTTRDAGRSTPEYEYVETEGDGDGDEYVFVDNDMYVDSDGTVKVDGDPVGTATLERDDRDA